MTSTYSINANPYPEWDLYFDEVAYDEESSILSKVNAVENYLLSNPNFIFGNDFFSIDIDKLSNNESFLAQWINFKHDLRDDPTETLNCVKLAVHHVKANKETNTQSDIYREVSSPIKLRILNYDTKLKLNDIKVDWYGKLVTIIGCVIRVGKVQELITNLTYVCSDCYKEVDVKQKNGVYRFSSITCDSCGVAINQLDLSSPEVKSVPFQVVRLQEQFGEINNLGTIPRVLDVELLDEWVNTCMPGDEVAVTGIIKMHGTDNGRLNRAKSNYSDLYLEAVTVENTKHKINGDEASKHDFSISDLKSIRSIYNSPDILSLLVHSLCPGIYGHEMVKMGLLLSLFGSVSNKKNFRSNIHVLLVGDPRLGKSQLLHACSRVSPKGIFVAGNSSTSSGLTVTMVKDANTNEYALEPGALVLADGGNCCIDEFDKMPTQHDALLESMEQQSVSVSKSGVVWTLPARTSILAAANPKKGRYDPSISVMKNLNISEPLLSRFDLKYLLLDKPNKELDKYICSQVMNFQNSSKGSCNALKQYIENRINSRMDRNLLEQILIESLGKTRVIPHWLLRKYISYARRYVRTRTSPEVAEVVLNYYLALRETCPSVDLRLLETLLRLLSARACIELREEPTITDALEIIELLHLTLICYLEPSFSRPSNISYGLTKSKNPHVHFAQMLEREAVAKEGKKTFANSELYEIGHKLKLEKSKVLQIIDKLNQQGILLKINTGSYQFVDLK